MLHSPTAESLVQENNLAKADPIDLARASFSGETSLLSPAFSKAAEKSFHLYQALHGGIWGIGAEANKILDIVGKSSPRELRLIAMIYKDHFKIDLAADILNRVRGKAREQAWSSLRVLYQGQGLKRSEDACIRKVSKPALEIMGAGERAGHLFNHLGKTFVAQNDVLELLQGLTCRELTQVCMEYKKQFNQDLPRRLDIKLSGRAHYFAHLLLNGVAENLAAAHQNTAGYFNFERAGIGGRLTAMVTKRDERVTQGLQDAREAIEKVQQATSEVERLQLERLAVRKQVYASQDVQTFSISRDGVAGLAADISASVGAAIMIAGAPLTWPVAVQTTCAAALAFLLCKKLIQGRTYNVQRVFADLALGLTEGALTIVTARTVQIARGLFGEFGQALLGQAVGAGVEEGASRTVREGVSNVMGRGALGSFGNTIGNIVLTALEKETWEKGLIAGTRAVAKSAVSGTLGSIAGSFGLSLSQRATQFARSKLMGA